MFPQFFFYEIIKKKGMEQLASKMLSLGELRSLQASKHFILHFDLNVSLNNVASTENILEFLER